MGFEEVVDSFDRGKKMSYNLNGTCNVQVPSLAQKRKPPFRAASWCRWEGTILRPWLYECHALTN